MIGMKVASVSDLVGHIKSTLEDTFHEVMVEGEVTNLSGSGAGHYYFTLSDDEASISCALFKGDAMRNPIIRTLKDGDKILVLGPLGVYQKRGTFQIIAKRIAPAGEGQLKLQFERLKGKLAAEGLFDLDRKKQIPSFPKKIVVITAKGGAALQDFLNVLKRRSLWMDVTIVPALVQGENAPKSLREAFLNAQKIPGVEVIVLTRGGGSLEDLWAFNDENLVRMIDACEIPVISAVGHQVDYSLCDFVADLRSETPTAAAETLSQPQTELLARINFCQTHLRSGLFKLKQHVEILNHKFHPRELQRIIWEKLQRAQKKLGEIRLRDRAHELIGLKESSQRVDESILKLQHALRIGMENEKSKLKRIEGVLGALNPSNVLGRGYAYLENEQGMVIGSHALFKSSPEDSILKINFHDGAGKVKKEKK
jgi:exodeoxyribonuclease VII large subunit